MKVLVLLYYYHPYKSGISEYAKRLSEELVKRGHQVTVLTSQHEPRLPQHELINGVEVVRCKPLFTYSKGPVMPNFFFKARRLFKNYDVVNIHMPLLEPGVFTLPPHTAITYHCDIRLGENFFDKLIERSYYSLARSALKQAPVIFTNTQDYAEHSPLLQPHAAKCRFAFPPIAENEYTRAGGTAFRKKHGLQGKKVIGFVGRIVYEKGIGYLLDAIPAIKKKYPNSTVVLVGDYKKVAGGSIMGSLVHKIDDYKDDILFLGKVPHSELLRFYSACDVLALPSIDPLESFGMVQIEAMYCGTPVVATDMPGVRIPIQLSQMGLLARSRSSADLAEKITRVLANRKKFIKSKKDIQKLFSIEKTVDQYEQVFKEIAHEK